METSLHRQLKDIYAKADAQLEVPLGRYRIDVVSDGDLVEIQHGSLAAIRDKVADLLAQDHRVLVVKPIVARKYLVKQDAKSGQVVSRRLSPKRGTVVDLFDELVYFTRVFPHKNLAIEVPLVEIEEYRYPGHGRRRRRKKNDYQVEDQKLSRVDSIYRFTTAAELLTLVPPGLPQPFHTGQLADQMEVDRWIAQRIAYCFREIGATKQVGKQGNSLLYRFSERRPRKSVASKPARSDVA